MELTEALRIESFNVACEIFLLQIRLMENLKLWRLTKPDSSKCPCSESQGVPEECPTFLDTKQTWRLKAVRDLRWYLG